MDDMGGRRRGPAVVARLIPITCYLLVAISAIIQDPNPGVSSDSRFVLEAFAHILRRSRLYSAYNCRNG